VLFVVFGGGSLLFRDYFAHRNKRLELAEPNPLPIPAPRPQPIDEQVVEVAAASANGDPTAEIHPV
jgi:hypothetical protein